MFMNRTGSHRRATRYRALSCMAVSALIALSGCFLWPGDNSDGTKPVTTLTDVEITSPLTDVLLAQGETFNVTWVGSTTGTVSIISVITETQVELQVYTSAPGDTSGIATITTSNLDTGTYGVKLTVQDAYGNTKTTTSPASILIIPAGTNRQDIAPTIRLTKPADNVGVAHNDPVKVAWLVTDPNGTGARVTVYLDTDTNANNDIQTKQYRVPGGPVAGVNILIKEDGRSYLVVPTGFYVYTGDTIEVRADGQVNDGRGAVAGPAGITSTEPNSTYVLPTSKYLTLIGRIGESGDWFEIGQQRIRPNQILATSSGELFLAVNEVRDTNIEGVRFKDNSGQFNAVVSRVNGAYLISTAAVEPNDPNGSITFIFDASKYPALPTYYIRATVDDQVNPPVSSYAPGALKIQSWASGPGDPNMGQPVVDLRDVGDNTAGALLQGFHGKADPLDPNQRGGEAGAWATSLGDFDLDGFDDFIVTARYSNPRGRGFVGQAYMFYGRQSRFSGINSLNSVGTSIRGCQFHAGRNWAPYVGLQGGDGGLASVSVGGDYNHDGKPDALIFGFPDICWYDYVDDDPLDEANVIYYDSYPNNESSAETNDDLGYHRLSAVVFLDSTQSADANNISSYLTRLENNTIDLRMVGQKDPGSVVDDEGLLMAGSDQPSGIRFRGAIADQGTPDNSGETVASIPDTNGDTLPDLLFSSPNGLSGRGNVQIRLGSPNLSSYDFTKYAKGNEKAADGSVKSWPVYFGEAFEQKDANGTVTGKYGVRFLMDFIHHNIIGGYAGDHLGRGLYAGDFNQDGSPDIACGAPEADRNGKTDCGVAYIVYGQLVVGNISILDHPRMEVVGTHDGDRLGESQMLIAGKDPNHGDFNGDGIDDVVLGAQHFTVTGVGADAGFAAVLFGGRQTTGERTYTVDDIATPALPGVKFIGGTPGALVGAMVSSAGDFNGDGLSDILITAPGAEYRYEVGGATQIRRGVCYLIFGSNRIENQTFTLAKPNEGAFGVPSVVGTSGLRGIVFVSPYEKSTADEAGVDTCFAIGDVNRDGYSDILIGNTHADYVSPVNPSQRRVDAGECYLIYGNNYGSNNADNW